MKHRTWIAPAALLITIVALGGGLAAWKLTALEEARAAFADEPEPSEAVTAVAARSRDYRPTTTSIGTVLALRSITLRNELAGTVRQVTLTPGQVVEAGEVLVALDVSVEEAELRSLEAQAELAETLHRRAQRLNARGAASDEEVDRARAERDVTVAQMERTRAVIARKTIRAPFRARVGLADLHVGQYLNEGTVLTTLQGVDESVHVDFAVPQHVIAGLGAGHTVTVHTDNGAPAIAATIVAIDARVDPATRNASVRARIDEEAFAPQPGASVRVAVPAGPSRQVVAVPLSALRKGPAGDHVFVLTEDETGQTRARLRPVQSGPMLDDEVIISEGLTPGELVAASGSFKLQDAALVAVANAVSGGPDTADAALADTAPGESESPQGVRF
jgi:membrane fusion protein, multidrug efflux system